MPAGHISTEANSDNGENDQVARQLASRRATRPNATDRMLVPGAAENCIFRRAFEIFSGHAELVIGVPTTAFVAYKPNRIPSKRFHLKIY